MKTSRIEITFPIAVDLPDDFQQRLVTLIGEACKAYEATHPDRTMWVFGVGSKITYMPMTREEEEAGRGMEYDDDTLSIEVSERERYHNWFIPKFIGYECCEVCGIVRNDGNRFGQCKGPARVGPRTKDPPPMTQTDEARAREIVAKHEMRHIGGRVEKWGLIDSIAKAIEAARREGAEQMREACAALAYENDSFSLKLDILDLPLPGDPT